MMSCSAKSTFHLDRLEAEDSVEVVRAAVRIQAAARKQLTRKRLVGELFDRIQSFDGNDNGCIDADEMKVYLQAVGEWDSDPLYTDREWARSWPAICEFLNARDPEEGLDRQSFFTFNERYRGRKLISDLRRVAAASMRRRNRHRARAQ
eukprot:SAG11_NODE_4809_length_1759_cov_2.496386_2_plen_149_part_00